MAATAQSLIERALRKVGALKRGFTLPDDEAQEALTELNAMVAEWHTRTLFIPYRVRETLTLVVGDGDYSIGTGGDFNTPRPMFIEEAYITADDGQDYILDKMDQRQYSKVHDKTTSRRPRRYYYETVFPLGQIYFDYLPDAAETLNLVSYKPLTGFASLTTEHTFPPEYDQLIVFNLAVRMAPEYDKEASPTVAAVANDAIQNMQNANLRNRVPLSETDFPLRPRGGLYDIEAG